MNSTEYSSYIFDCDGVILNSNEVKSRAFYKLALPLGSNIATQFVEYHKANGGISRFKKIEYLLNSLMPLANTTLIKGLKSFDYDSLLSKYSELVLESLLKCEVTPALKFARYQTANANWFIVSGGDQSELRNVFSELGLSVLFNGGIFGSPSTKEEIFEKIISQSMLKLPAVFFGDSLYDYSCAKRFGLDFVFVSSWTDVKDWQSFVKENDLREVPKVSDFFPSPSAL